MGHRADRCEQLLGRARLHREAARPAVERAAEHVPVVHARVEEHAQVGVLLEQAPAQVDPAAVGQVDVDDRDVGAAALDQGLGRCGVVGCADHPAVAPPQEQLEPAAEGDVVLHDHDIGAGPVFGHRRERKERARRGGVR